MIWKREVIFPALFLRHFSDILTIIFRFISASLSVYAKYSCVTNMWYILLRGHVCCALIHDSRPPSILPSLVSAVNRSIRIQSLFYYLFKIISSLRTLLKHAYCYLNRLLISRLQLHILSSSSENSMNLQIADVVWKETFNIVFHFSISSFCIFY